MENTFIMLTKQLQAGDIVTESGLRMREDSADDRNTREVQITSVRSAAIEYRGVVMPVWYVSGSDLRNGAAVRYTSNTWRRWTTRRYSADPELAIA